MAFSSTTVHASRHGARAILLFAAAGSLGILAAADTAAPGSHPASSQNNSSQPATRTPEQRRQDDINRVMDFFRLTQPDVFDQAKTLRLTDPAKFDKLIMGTLPTVNHLENMRKQDPKLFDLSMQDLQLNYQSMRLAQELKRADLADGDRKNLTAQVKSVVTAEFAIQQQIHQMEIDTLRQKVKDLDNQVHEREDGKDALIQKRVDDLIEHTPHLDW